MASNAWLACSTVSTCCTTGWVVATASRDIAPSRVPTASSTVFHSGCSFSVVRDAIHEANPSFNHRSSHQRIVTRSPNHWCAISCAAVLKIACLSDGVEIVGSISKAYSKV